MIPPSLWFRPSERAEWLFRRAARGGRGGRWARMLLITFHGCDVSTGAQFLGTLRLPHPLNIVVGAGCIIGDGVTICQGVTLGHTRNGGYPKVEDGATIFPGAIVVGDITIGAGAIVGPQSLVVKDVPPGGSTRAPLAEIRPAASEGS